MPLTKLQSHVLRILADHRSPESFVAGGIVLNREGPRFSGDIDIFNDVAAKLESIVANDMEVLRQAGLTVSLNDPRSSDIRKGKITGLGDQTEIDWVFDSDFRFFPAIKDEQFGYALHPVDLAINKASAAASRRVPRDIIDLLTIDRHILPLGPVLCAAVGRFPGPSPEELLDDISRNSRFTPPEFQALAVDRPLDPADVYRNIKLMLERARDFIARMPSGALGIVFLRDGKAAEPDPDRLTDFVKHEGKRRGHWPTSSEIGSAMLEKYQET